MMINKNKKQGISLIVLLITIAVILIILTVVVISVDNVSNNAKLAAFASDLSTIEDLTTAYYMENSTFPVSSDEQNALSKSELLTKVGDENKTKFSEELELNNDNDATNDYLSEFYVIDLNKLDIESSKRGVLKDEDEKDVYVVAYPSMNIYYVKGVKAKDDIYFSLSSKLTNRVKLDEDMTYKSDNSTTVQSIEGLTVKKITKGWTNSIGIYVQANLDSDEELYLEATGVENKKLITNVGNNEFSFDDLSQVNGFTQDESTNFKNMAQNNKKIIFTKKKASTEIGKIEVDMSNYETTLPTYSIDSTAIIYSEEYNMIPFTVADSISGVKEVRYEYLTKYDESGNLTNYYTNVNEYDIEYLKTKGKRAIPDKNGNITLKIDKDIQGIQLIVIDKAGNVLSKNNNDQILAIGMYNEPNNVYIGLDLKENSDNLLAYSVVLINQNGISTLEVQTSIDGVTYSESKVITVNSTSSEKLKIIEEKEENLGKIKFLKVIATDNNALVKNKITRIFKLSDKNSLDIGKITNESKTFNLKSKGVYYNPVVPSGFAPINEGNAIWGSADGWNNGLVIRDEIGNEFVWVPVESTTEEEFKNKFVTYPFSLTEEEFKNYSEKIDDEFNDMQTSVKNNGGFYISRYEISDTGLNGEFVISSKPRVSPLGGKTIDEAKLISRSMYPNLNRITDFGLSSDLTNNTGVISTLIYGRQWDAALKFIEKDYIDYPLNSQDKGNYNTSSVQNTGSNSNYNFKNIYDMAGNLYEWTMELNGGDAVARGGSYLTVAANTPASYRNSTFDSGNIAQYGFRVALYINN